MINGNDINCGRKEEKCRMFDSDEISERLTNRLIRKKTAELGEIEEYQRRIKKTIIYLRNLGYPLECLHYVLLTAKISYMV